MPIHRIDRETAGLVLFSLQASSRGAYQQLFAERHVTKHYEAIVPWADGRTLLGIPILHDRIYPRLLPEGTDDFAHPLQLLAKHLRFTDPVTGALREFTSPRTLVL